MIQSVMFAGTVRNDLNREFSVMVRPGEYDADRPVIEFRDMTYQGAHPGWEFGQPFGARYYVETLEERLESESDLSLMGDEWRWTITAKNVREAVKLARAAIAKTITIGDEVRVVLKIGTESANSKGFVEAGEYRGVVDACAPYFDQSPWFRVMLDDPRDVAIYAAPGEIR